MPFYNYAIVACARWETENLVEWVLYHRSIGFDHIYFYCNDDDPADAYRVLLPFIVGPKPFLSFVHFPFVGAQKQMYRHFLREHANETAWFIFLDVDEFFVSKEHGTISGFVRHYETFADVIFLNWLVFGHNGFKERPTGSVLLNYTRRDQYVHPYTKVLTRTSALDVQHFVEHGETGFWHSWNVRNETLHRYVNVIEEDMSGYYADFERSARAYLDTGDRQARIIDTAVIHHYQFRSETEIERRIQRGTSMDFGGQRSFLRVLETGTLAEFLAPFSAVEDRCLHDYWRYLLDGATRATIIDRPRSVNVALGKPALQSSISPFSGGRTTFDDAGRLVSGTFSGAGNCHTSEEDHPWWLVDLTSVRAIREIQIFNRVDLRPLQERANRFTLEVSTDFISWQTLYRADEPTLFGGIDGRPFIWRSDTAVAARFVRITLLACTSLHLDAVEIYEDVSRAGAADSRNYGPLTDCIVRNAAAQSN